jgi:hypothetical protein
MMRLPGDFEMARSLTETAPPHAPVVVPMAARIRSVFSGFAFAMLVAGAAPVLACPAGPRPTGDYATYVAACAGVDDHFVPIDPGKGGFFVSATETYTPSIGIGIVNQSASVGTILGDPVHPDLHASVIGLVGSTIHQHGDASGEAMAEFRDIIIPRHNKRDAGFFRMDFSLDGILSTPPDGVSDNYGIVALNIGIADPDDPTRHRSAGIGFSTQDGIFGPVSTTIGIGMNVCVRCAYVLTGDLSVFAFGNAGSGETVDFAADFGTTAKFLGVHFFTDETQTEELFDFTLDSAFGFNYLAAAPPVSDVVEPGSLVLLATALGLAGFARRRVGAAAHAAGAS